MCLCVCREFLTGFRKRKLKRKQEAVKRTEERLKQEKLAIRKEVRHTHTWGIHTRTNTQWQLLAHTITDAHHTRTRSLR